MPEKMRSGVTIPDYIKKTDQENRVAVSDCCSSGRHQSTRVFEVPYEVFIKFAVNTLIVSLAWQELIHLEECKGLGT